MKEVYRSKAYTFYEYKPTVLRPFYMELEKLYLKRRLRLAIAYFSGYKVYYVKENERYVGYCVVSQGGASRYWFSNKADIIVGPYYICPEYRGRKLSELMLDVVLNRLNIDYACAYEYIAKNNRPSIKAAKSIGFYRIKEADVTPLLRNIRPRENGTGTYWIFKLDVRREISANG